MDNRKARITGIQHLSFIIASALCLFLHGCGVTPTAPYPEPRPSAPPLSTLPQQPSTYVPGHGKGAALYDSARQAMTQGRYHDAELALERALRIEPRNGYYWYSLAEAKYRRGNYRQAVQLALKSKSMAGGNSGLLQQNDALITASRAKMGTQ